MQDLNVQATIEIKCIMGIDLSLRHCTLYNQICYAAMYTSYLHLKDVYHEKIHTCSLQSALQLQDTAVQNVRTAGHGETRERYQLIVITHHSNQPVPIVTFWFCMMKRC